VRTKHISPGRSTRKWQRTLQYSASHRENNPLLRNFKKTQGRRGRRSNGRAPAFARRYFRTLCHEEEFPLAHDGASLSGKHQDVATVSLIENWIDETERHTWFSREILGDF